MDHFNINELSQNERNIWTYWEAKTSREVVREAASKGLYINLAKQYLQYKNKWDESTASDWFKSEVFAWVLQLLLRKQFFKASHVLTKINIPPQKHMLDIAKESFEPDLREYITEQLVKTADLQNEFPEEWKTFIDNKSLLKLLENSFEYQGIQKQNRVFGSGKDMIVVNLSSVKQLSVEKIEKYPLEWKKTVAAHLFLDTFDFSIVGFLDPEYLWKILLQRNFAILLKRWITLSNNKEKIVSGENLQSDLHTLKSDAPLLASEELLSKVDDLLMSWPITNAMIESIPDCNSFGFTMIYVYDTLCTFGHVIDAEQKDFKAVSNRLSRANSLRNAERIFSIIKNNHQIDLNDSIVKYCIKNNLFHALMACVNVENLNFSYDDVVNRGTEHYLDLWLLFKYVQSSDDVQRFTFPIYETCKYLTGDLNDYFTQNSILIIALLLFENKNLFDIFNDDMTLSFRNFTLKWNSPLKNLWPHLYSVYERWKSNSIMIKNDVTVYQLLSGYKGLDIAKIFEFQLSNKEYSKRDMPHFCNEELVETYAFKKKLDYFYYLKQNRPCLASLTLLSCSHNFNSSSSKVIKDACNQAHTYALKNWSNEIITASCIAFIAMIGCDPAKCRIHIASVNMIKNYLEKSNVTFKINATNRVNEIVNGLLNDCNFASSLFDILIKATELNIYLKSQDEAFGFGDVLNEWQTAMKFAYFHNLALPEAPLKKFVSDNDWLSFLLFGDAFKYPQNTMLSVCQGFHSQSLIEHLMQAIKHSELIQRLDTRKKSIDRKHSNDKSVESLTTSTMPFTMGDDLWEIMSCCHGPEDPPDALIKASDVYRCPLLALLATCYEPDAVDTFWAQWMLTSMKKEISNNIIKYDTYDASEIVLTDEQVIQIMEIAIEHGYFNTLLESLEIFYKDSPLCFLVTFFIRTVQEFEFDSPTIETLQEFIRSCRRLHLTNGKNGIRTRFMESGFVDRAAVAITLKAFSAGFKSGWFQKEYLRCLCEAEFTEHFIVPGPDFWKILIFLNITMKCGIEPNWAEICSPKFNEAALDYINVLIDNRFFDEALNFANIAAIAKDDILIAEWKDKYTKFPEENIDPEEFEDRLLQFWMECSYTLKKFEIDPMKAIKFLRNYCDEFKDGIKKFYMLRVVLGWFDGLNNEFSDKDAIVKDDVEFEMWNTYLSCDDYETIKLVDFNSTYDLILNLDEDVDDSKSASNSVFDGLFRMLLSEILEQSDMLNMKYLNRKLDGTKLPRWICAVNSLISSGLIVEAWRLNKIFNVDSEAFTPAQNPLLIIETSLQIAEGIITPYDLPSSLRSIVSSPLHRTHTSESQLSDSSFEELVLIPDKAEEVSEEVSPLAGRRDADALSILETLAVRTGFRILKQVSDYFRIALQIGWSYERILKYSENPLDIINQLSGRSRMHLAKIVFRTYNIPSYQIMSYLCYEIIQAIVSPHLTRISGFRQKEHFRYTLWGYPVDTDFEMFLNLCPNDNSTLGKKILEYLGGIRKMYKCPGTTTVGVEVVCEPNAEVGNDDDFDNDQAEIDSISESSEYKIEMNPSTSQTMKNVDVQSVISGSGNLNYRRRIRNKKQQQMDVITCSNIHISSVVYKNLKALMKSIKLTTKQINVISIELLVLAHNCFSSVCDTEGIAATLRSAQTLTSHLLAAHSWRLMVRLLTGMARYTEMAFIFQILKENEQFEFLLGQFDYMLSQCEDKISNFKQGLLEYLRVHCPGNTELYCMVALHFNMHSEAGDVKKKQAVDLIASAKQMAVDSMKITRKKYSLKHDWIIWAENDSTEWMLQGSLNHLIDSAELYAKGESLGPAREMAALAQLVSLQLGLIRKPPAICLFDIDKEGAIAAIDSHLTFMEGLVFAHARDAMHGGWISEWKEIVYQKVLRGDDLIFINDIMLNRPDIAYYIIQRYDLNKNTGIPENKHITELRTIFK